MAHDFLVKDLVLEGYRGEFATCFILLLGRLRVKEGEFYSTPISLTRFLCAIFNKVEIKNQINDVLPTWENAQLSFTHFIQYHASEQLFHRDPQDLLEWLFERCQAVVMPPGWTGADILIPIYFPTQKVYSYALIQAKNVLKFTRQDLVEARRKLIPPVVFGNSRGHFHWFSQPAMLHAYDYQR